MIEQNKIYNEDCLQGMQRIPDGSVDLVVTDPPYEFNNGGVGGAFGISKRDYHTEYLAICREPGKKKEAERLRIMANSQNNIKYTNRQITKGFDFAVLDECCRILKKINIYIWCSKAQVRKLLEYFEAKGCYTDILVWCKTNPTPMCNNTYLSDIEYCIFAREKGVQVFGDYSTKHKFWVSECNVDDKKIWGHPTIKPCKYIRQQIINSSRENDLILDPFMGSGTTAVACIREKRNFIGFEINPEYFEKANERIKNELLEPSLEL